VVLSRPEPNLAILSMGKRDASHDLGLPHPLLVQREGAAAPDQIPAPAEIFKMNDQHAYLRLPEGFDIKVGDLVGCGISHPCTTFDKWPMMLVVDDSYRITGAVNTFF
jgi:D-serine dehydratase